MFGESYSAEQSLKISKKSILKLDSLENCPGECTYNGLCKDGKCYCEQGYYGDDCSIADANYYKKGASIEKVLKYGAGCFGIGIIIGKSR